MLHEVDAVGLTPGGSDASHISTWSSVCGLHQGVDRRVRRCAGTGKTDTAVQIMHVLYANNPGQRVLLITHSNQALNDLFSKLLER